MPNRSSYLEFLIEQVSPLGEITSRSMFGGHAVYCDGTVFAPVASDTLYLKSPPEIFEDLNTLRRWDGGAVAAARRSQARKSSTKRPASGR